LSERASLKQADTLYPTSSPMLGAGQRGVDLKRQTLNSSPLPDSDLRSPVLQEENQLKYLSILAAIDK
jgi:hypothetical protein